MSELTDRLRERARQRVKLAIFSNPPLTVEETPEWQAAAEIERLEKDAETLAAAVLELASAWKLVKSLQLLQGGMKIEQAKIHAEAELSASAIGPAIALAGRMKG